MNKKLERKLLLIRACQEMAITPYELPKAKTERGNRLIGLLLYCVVSDKNMSDELKKQILTDINWIAKNENV